MALSDEELDRYARHIVLPQVGGVGQNKLKAAKAHLAQCIIANENLQKALLQAHF